MVILTILSYKFFCMGDISILWYLLQFLFFFSVLIFSLYNSLTSLIIFIASYLLEAIGNVIASLISFSVCLSFVCQKTADFCVSNLYPDTLLIMFICCRRFFFLYDLSIGQSDYCGTLYILTIILA